MAGDKVDLQDRLASVRLRLPTLARGVPVYVGLNVLIAILLLFRFFSSHGGADAVSQGWNIARHAAILLVWFALSYLSFRSVSFERWCDIRGSLSRGEWYRALAVIVDANYRPMVRLLQSRDEVSLAARDLITDKKNTSIFLNGKVIFLGAAANQSDRSRREALVISEDSERTPAQVYQGAVEEAMSKLSPIYRVVSLLSLKEFSERSLEKKRQYLSWIVNQIAQLKRNKNYILLDNKRAPKWGASGAAIFSSSGYLQFTSAGGRALFVRDEWLSRRMMAAIMANLSEARAGNKAAYTQMEKEEIALYSNDNQFGDSRSADDLNRHFEELDATLRDTDMTLPLKPMRRP